MKYQKIIKKNLGIMQGRLSPIKRNKIQEFPINNWKNEFEIAKKLGFNHIEWTLDYNHFNQNPIFVKKKIKIIKNLKKKFSIKIISLTGDCFMQKPFWKKRKNLNEIKDLKKIIKACDNLGIKYLVIPLVDNGSIKNHYQEVRLIDALNKILKLIKKTKVIILFESDYCPKKLKIFITKFNPNLFGINYDVGNSASLGYNIEEEFNYYGKFIKGVHIKDRKLYGKSVRLGKGRAKILTLLKLLKKINYNNQIIFQTARSKSGNDISEIKENLSYFSKKIWKI